MMQRIPGSWAGAVSEASNSSSRSSASRHRFLQLPCPFRHDTSSWFVAGSEELAHEGRKAAGSGKAGKQSRTRGPADFAPGRCLGLGKGLIMSSLSWRKVEEAVQAGWATLVQTVKVRQSKSKDSKVVGFVEEGRRVRISQVCSKSAQLEEPLVGWVTLSKGGAVLRQEPSQKQQASSATMWAVANVMARYGAKTEPTPGAVPTLQSLVSATSGSSADVAEVVLETDAAVAVTVQAVEAPASEKTTGFHFLPSVATWLSAAVTTSGTDMPPMEDQAVVVPAAEEPKAEVREVRTTPFRQLPSVGTWLSAHQLGRQGDQNELLRQRRPLSSSRRAASTESSESESFWVTLRRALREMCCVGR